MHYPATLFDTFFLLSPGSPDCNYYLKCPTSDVKCEAPFYLPTTATSNSTTMSNVLSPSVPQSSAGLLARSNPQLPAKLMAVALMAVMAMKGYSFTQLP